MNRREVAEEEIRIGIKIVIQCARFTNVICSSIGHLRFYAYIYSFGPWWTISEETLINPTSFSYGSLRTVIPVENLYEGSQVKNNKARKFQKILKTSYRSNQVKVDRNIFFMFVIIFGYNEIQTNSKAGNFQESYMQYNYN